MSYLCVRGVWGPEVPEERTFQPGLVLPLSNVQEQFVVVMVGLATRHVMGRSQGYC